MNGTQLDIFVPVRDEERDLEPSVRRLVEYLRRNVPFTARVTILDNGSTDRTWAIAGRLAAELAEVRAVHTDLPGKGRALRAIWGESDADVLVYMDVDLSTDLNALLPLVAPLLSGHSDLALGTRLARGARVIRGAKREVISRCYNLLLRTFLRVGFSDANCGFKAIRRDLARTLLPLTEDNGWFFDTELLVLAERAGLRIHEVPVDWVDDLDSSVDIPATALTCLRGIVRLGRRLASGTIKVPLLRDPSPGVPPTGRRPGPLGGKLVHFGAIGAASTLAYLVLYLLLRGVMAAQPANAVSLLATAIANTAANRRMTFGISGRVNAIRHQLKGLLAFGAGLALTGGALTALHAFSARPGTGVEVAVLVGANLLATGLRFLLYLGWVFGGPKHTAEVPLPALAPPQASRADAA